MASIHPASKSSWRKNLPKVWQYLILCGVVVIIFVPIVILIFGSLKTRGEMYSQPYALPSPLRWENYGRILGQPTFWRMLLNSLLVMTVVTAAVVFICSLAAFVFARKNFRGKTLLFLLFTLGLMFPINVAILPVYLVPVSYTHLDVYKRQVILFL